MHALFLLVSVEIWIAIGVVSFGIMHETTIGVSCGIMYKLFLIFPYDIWIAIGMSCGIMSELFLLVSAEIWIAIGVSCGVFLLILVLAVVCFLRRRRKQAEQRNG